MAWYKGDKDLDAIEDEAMDWMGGRLLDSLYLVQGPQIILWRTGNVISIRWDNSEKLIDGIPVWTAKKGLYEISVNDFLLEVESFHKRFTGAMKDRVNAIATNWSRPNVEVDINRLVEEQSERERALSEALAVQHNTNWEIVRKGKRLLNELKVISHA